MTPIRNHDYRMHELDRRSLQGAGAQGKNRPWFIQLLVRNLRLALAGLRRRVGAFGDGPDRDRARPRRAVGRTSRDRVRACLRHREFFARRPRHRTTSTRWRRRILARSGRSAAGVVPRVGDGAPTSGFRSRRRRSSARSAGSSRRRKAGASISSDPALTIHIEMLPDARVLLLRQGAGRRRPADRAPAGAWRVCCRAASIRRSPRTA